MTIKRWKRNSISEENKNIGPLSKFVFALFVPVKQYFNNLNYIMNY